MRALTLDEVLWHHAKDGIGTREADNGPRKLAHDARGAGTVDEDAVVPVDLLSEIAGHL